MTAELLKDFEDLHTFCELVSIALDEDGPSQVATNDKAALICLDIALEHLKSMTQIAAKQRFATIAALLRVVIDAWTRHHYLHFCVQPDEVEGLLQRDLFPRVDDMVKAIERVAEEPDSGWAETAVEMMGAAWKDPNQLHSFTHTGTYAILMRSGDNGEVIHQSGEEEIDALLAQVKSLVIGVVAGILDLYGSDTLAQKVAPGLEQVVGAESDKDGA